MRQYRSALKKEQIIAFRKSAIKVDPNKEQQKITGEPLRNLTIQGSDKMKKDGFKIATENIRDL